MPTLGTWIAAHKSDEVRATFWLVKLGLSPPIYLTDCDQPIVFDFHTFEAAPISVTGLQSDAAEAGGGRLALAPGDAAWVAVLAAFAAGTRTFEVTFWEAWLDIEDFPSPVPAEVRAVAATRVEAAEWSREGVVLTLGPASDPALSRLPFREYQTICTYRAFKGAQCGYSGVETTCDRTLAACTARSNTARFGGFLSFVKDGQVITAQYTVNGVSTSDSVTVNLREA